MKKIALSLFVAFSAFAKAPTPKCKPLAERLSIHDVAVTETIATSSLADNPGSFGQGATLRPIVLGIQPDQAVKVGWVDTKGVTHITALDKNLKATGKEVTVPGMLRDFVAHNEGSAVLTQGGGMHLTRFDNELGQIFRVRLIGNPTNNMHMGSLAYDGVHYRSYFGITGTSGYQAGHQGEALVQTDTNGASSVLRGWGCSHAIDARYITYDDKFFALCLSDAFPSMGLFFNHGFFKGIAGDKSGGSSGRIAGMVGVDGNIAIAYTAYERAHLEIVDAGTRARIHSWPLPYAPGKDKNLKVARFGQKRVLVSWKRGEEQVVKVYSLEGEGALEEESDNIGAWAHPRGDFKTFANGDVAWATQWVDSKILRVMRLNYCE